MRGVHLRRPAVAMAEVVIYCREHDEEEQRWGPIRYCWPCVAWALARAAALYGERAELRLRPLARPEGPGAKRS